MAPTQCFPGFVSQSHYFDVPLDYEKPSEKTIKVFGREVVATENQSTTNLPWLVFLQGGPGFQSPRPESSSGWLKRALKEYRVLLLDQRGTGLSTPVTHESLGMFADPQSQFEYLKHFRADNIVRDCEIARKSVAGNQPWTVLGQSYGGFCSTTYLSLAPEGLSGVINTGGIPPITSDTDEVYRATYKQVIAKNKIFYQRFPENVKTVHRIVEHLEKHQEYLPSGEPLTVERFLQLGLLFGMRISGNSMNTIHYLLERVFATSTNGERLAYAFLREVERLLSFNTNPIYALLHEQIYCQEKASNWSAARLLAEFPEFDPKHSPLYFTGEMIYPWMFDQYSCLKPLKAVSELLATYSGWGKLYDTDVLQKNKVPCAAVIYKNDMYVDRQLAETAAAKIRGLKIWSTDEYEHDGLREDGEKVLDQLLKLLKESQA